MKMMTEVDAARAGETWRAARMGMGAIREESQTERISDITD
jgi:hypothetical protein